MIWDQCCDCGSGPGTAAMAARFNWPGWAAFTADPSSDTSGMRYRTLTVDTYWQGNHPDGSVSFVAVTASISCSSLDGSFLSDTFTGSALPTLDTSDGTAWVLAGIQAINDPANVVTATKLSIPSTTSGGITYPEISLNLSDPVTLADCKTKANALYSGSGGVDSLTAGQFKEVHYKQSPETRFPSAMAQYMQPGTELVYDSGTGLSSTVYCWDSVGYESGGSVLGMGHITVCDSGLGYWVTCPFGYNGDVVETVDGSETDAAVQQYTQTTFWYLNEVKFFVVTGSACVTDNFSDTSSGGTPTAVNCFMQSVSGGNLKLTVPDLTADTSQHIAEIARTAQFGYSLTGGGCPCVCTGIFTWSVHNPTGSAGTWYLTFDDGGAFWGSGNMTPGTYALAAGATDGPHNQTFDCVHGVTISLRSGSPTGPVVDSFAFAGNNGPYTFNAA